MKRTLLAATILITLLFIGCSDSEEHIKLIKVGKISNIGEWDNENNVSVIRIDFLSNNKSCFAHFRIIADDKIASDLVKITSSMYSCITDIQLEKIYAYGEQGEYYLVKNISTNKILFNNVNIKDNFNDYFIAKKLNYENK